MTAIITVRHLFAALTILAIGSPSASAAVFQYTVAVTTSKNPSAAFLWIPPQAKQVRGLLVAGMTLMEREFAKDQAIRNACQDEGLAILFFKCGLSEIDMPKVLNDLAQVSGYHELPVVPLMFVGHSAGGPQAKALTIKMANRCFGLVLYRGGVPGGNEAVPPGVPVLMMIGQFDEFGGMLRDASGRETWEGGRDALADFRSKDSRNLASVVVEPGAGHFAWSDRNAAYLAIFIRKAAQARIPDWPSDLRQPVHCKSVDPEGGWLSNLTIKTAGQFAPAPYRQYAGDKAREPGTSTGRWPRPPSRTTSAVSARRTSSSAGRTPITSMQGHGTSSAKSSGSAMGRPLKCIHSIPTSTPCRTRAAARAGRTLASRRATPRCQSSSSQSAGRWSRRRRTRFASVTTTWRRPPRPRGPLSWPSAQGMPNIATPSRWACCRKASLGSTAARRKPSTSRRSAISKRRAAQESWRPRAMPVCRWNITWRTARPKLTAASYGSPSFRYVRPFPSP